MSYPPPGGYGYPAGYPSSYGHQPQTTSHGYGYVQPPGGIPMPSDSSYNPSAYGHPTYTHHGYPQASYSQPDFGHGTYNQPGYVQSTHYPTSGDMPMPSCSPSMHGMAYAASAAVNFRSSGYSPQPSTQYSGMPHTSQPSYLSSSGSPYPTGTSEVSPYSIPTPKPVQAAHAQPHSQLIHQQPQQPAPQQTPPQPVLRQQQQQQQALRPQVPLQMKDPPTQGTVKDFTPFDAQKDAEALRKAMKGLGTDEKTITHIVGTRSNRQRQVIKLEFATLYGKDLIKELKSELSSNYERTILALFMTPEDYDAYEMFNAMEGVGTDEKALIEILCTRTNSQIQIASAAYKKMFKKDLEKEIQSETSGHFRRLLVSLCQGSRLENQPLDQQKAAEDAQALYKAGEAKWGTDESRFNVVLASRSFPQLRLTFEEYRKISRKTLEQAIESEMSGDLKDGMKSIVKSAHSRPAFFAERLYKSMKGLGTDDKTLIRIMVSRSEIDMVQIKEEFQKTYGKTLAQFIADDCSGDYKKLLLQLCGN